MTARIAALMLTALMAAGCGQAPPKGVAHRNPTSQSPTPTPQVAVPRIEGPYKVVAGGPDTPPVTWIFTACGDGCAQVEIGGEGSSQRATARYVNMNWTVDMHSTHALQCGDGTPVPGTAHYSWNPDTLEGRYWSTADRSSPCGYEQSLDTYPVPLTLTWAGPPRAGA
jgi:hypothetical protein